MPLPSTAPGYPPIGNTPFKSQPRDRIPPRGERALSISTAPGLRGMLPAGGDLMLTRTRPDPMKAEFADPATTLERYLSDKAPGEASAILAMRFRDPATVYEWQLWRELQAEFSRWKQPGAPAHGPAPRG